MLLNQTRTLAVVAAFAALAASAQALLIDPSTGTVIFDSTVAHDDDTATRALGGTFNYYGNAYTSMSVCVNGHMDALTNSDYSNPAYPSGTEGTQISPFFDDLYIFAAGGGTLKDQGVAGTYYAVTWHTQHIQDAGANINAQALLIMANTTIQNFNFLTGDIAFSYETVSQTGTFLSSTVGLNKGDGIGWASGPGTSNGSENGSGLPVFTSSRHFFLFRNNGQGGYNATIETAPVPEPASMAALGLGALALIRRRRSK